jgi:hypothetical protein
MNQTRLGVDENCPLYRRLLSIVLNDRAKAERLVQLARSKDPWGCRKVWVRHIVDQWQRDNH